MNEAAAREVVLVQAFETAQPPAPSWSEDDRAWATRVALEDAAPGDDAAFIARRAHHALQRLAPREQAAATWLTHRLWRWRWIGWAVLIGGVVGLLADSIGSSQRINLLAPPVWTVLVWNLVVYVILLGHGLARLLTRRTQSGGLLKLTERVLRIGRSLPGLGSVSASASGSAKALQGFATQWLRVSAPLSAARAATVLHAAAAALAIGLIAGLYLRGLVLDYRATWQSTFIGAATAHDILSIVLAPAVALSGSALPDAAAFEAMRSVQGAAATNGAPAAPWIHWLAITLLAVVVVPRLLLALLAAACVHWLQRHLTPPLKEPYYQRLVRARQGEVAHVFVLPYASAPGEHAEAALHALMLKTVGDAVRLEVASVVAFGAEDDDADEAHARTWPTPPPGTTLAIALFDLSATPEIDNQGRFALRLAAHAPTIMLIDEATFAPRFKADPSRLAQRRDAWRVLAVGIGTTPVFFNSTAADDASARGVALAMRSPVSVAA